MLLSLPDEDRDFILQFVLASGSLKEMAQLYGVSYPTIRASLDRIISNLRQALNGQPPDPLTELLARLIERGELKPATARTIRSVYREALERKSQ
ncbi:DUF2089 domain-containing protein [Acidicapsa dinghuensis]|uniref:DUF2089 domain-containing protein n=1 Tax=Acidicapsa dinghuensis TaxID=2218256 RepID=A0ABW1EJZ0_9BACT|nr:DUF2089 domain-containing protein [Acidicapsa dinghuensis]